MQKISILSLLCFFVCLQGSAQNIPNGQSKPGAAVNVNPLPAAYGSTIAPAYTRTWANNKPGASALQIAEAAQIRDAVQSTEYTDGMGRPLQSVKKGISPSGKDFVSPKLYDAMGREGQTYLSYASPAADGKLKLNPFAEQASFLQGLPQYAGEQVYYSTTIYDNSPLSNVEKALPVGNSYGGSNRGITFKYESNGINEVAVWSVDQNINAIPSFSGYYPAAVLYRGISIDANGKRTVSYKDKEGKLILKKIELKNDGAADITSHSEWLSTYYVYDDVGNARCTITPRAVEWLIANGWQPLTQNIVNELCFRYEYDDKGRTVISHAPGADEIYTVFDVRDRAVMVQDGNLRTNGQWQYTLYDDQNRVLEHGLWTNNQSREDHQAAAENTIGYPQVSGSSIILQQNSFDNYNSINTCGCGLPSSFDAAQLNGGWLNGTASSQFPYPLALIQSQRTLGLQTFSKFRVLNSNPVKFLYSLIFYDEKGNVIQTISTNLSGGQDITTTQYGYDGRVLATHLKHIYYGSVTQQTHDIFTRSEYDDVGRLLKSFKRIDNDVEKLQHSNTYNELNQLVNVELGKSLTTGLPLDIMEFSYTLSGSAKATNESFVNGTVNDRYFGEIVNRDYGFSQAQFNGNIAGVQWRTLGSGEKRAFGYSYDPANRVLKAEFTQYTGGWNNNANIDYSSKLGDGLQPSSAYDANGNIIAVSHKALKLYQSDVVDNLSYQYENNNFSNKLTTIAENAGAGTAADATENILGDFKDNVGGNLGYDYQYDANGNQTMDNNKGITSISYNVLDQPLLIQITGKGTISFVYDAEGQKLKKTITPLDGPPVTYNYIGEFTYKDDQLEFCNTEFGRIRPIVTQAGTPGWAFDYFEKDYLGNLRTILTDEVRTDIYPPASLESANSTTEATYYKGIDVGLTPRPGDFGDATTNGNQVQLLRKDILPTGMNKLMKVMVKDQINVTVDYYFPAQTADNSLANGLTSLVNLLTPLFNTAGAPAALAGKGFDISQEISNSIPFSSFITPQHPEDPGSVPKAYLNILFFDEQFRFVSQNSTFVGVSVAGSRQTITKSMVEAPKNGYVYIYVSNESNNLVYFDNFQVSHVRGPLIEEDHYNLFGAKMNGICSRSLPDIYNKIGYQGKELEDALDLDWNDFEARNYDPQIGRFIEQDPAYQFASPYVGMGNNWAMGTDPNGKYALFDDIVAIVVGAAVNVIGNWGNIHSAGTFFEYLGVGALSGEATLYGGPLAGGAVVGLGNAVVGGVTDPMKLLQNTAVGALSGYVGGQIGGALSGVISAPLSNAIGSQASGIATNIVSSTVVGGGFGAGFALFNGENAWQGFLSGMRTGAISGAISSAVPAVMNKFGSPKPPVTPQAEEPALKPAEVEPVKTELEPANTQKLLPAPTEMKLLPAPRNFDWDQPHGPGGFEVERILLESEYKTFVRTQYAKTIDGIEYPGDGVVAKCVSIKSTGWYGKEAGRLNVYKNIRELGDMHQYQTKILQVVTPPGFRITNLSTVKTMCAELHIVLKISHL